MTTILRVLAEIIIYSAVLFGAILLFKRVFKKQLSAMMQYAVWFLMILRLLVPITVDSGVSLFVIPQPQTQVIQQSMQPVDAAPSSSGYTNQAEEETLSNPQPNLNDQITDNEKSEQIKNTNWKINWQWILVMLWVAGMGISFSYTVFLWIKLEHELKKKGVIVSESIQILIEKCKKELGIKADIQSIVFQGTASPALTASLRPKLLLPYGLEEQMDAKQIEFIVMHELTHYKRKDHLVSFLLMALRCVYWFNPVVWLAFPIMRTDMEAACDAKVASRLNQLEQKRYITTIIDLGGASRAQYMLGMGIRGRRSMEKRIQGIYLRKKTKAAARFAAFLLAAVMGLLCFTTACQPIAATAENTPSSSAAAELSVSSAPTPRKSAEPSAPPENRYTEAKQLLDIVSVNYDALVVEPEGSVPVADVDIRDFTEADVQKAVDYFFPDGQAYAPWQLDKAYMRRAIAALEKWNAALEDARDGFLSAHPWAAELYRSWKVNEGIRMEVTKEMRAEYGLTDEDVEAYRMTVEGYEEAIHQKEEEIGMYKQELERVPETAERKPAEVQFGNDKYASILLNGENETGGWAQISAFRKDGGLNSQINYYREFGIVVQDPELLELTIPRDEAQKLAEDAVAAICPELTLAGMIMSSYDHSDLRLLAADSYVFLFTRQVGGAQITPDTYFGGLYYHEVTDEAVNFEMIRVAVDNYGVSYFEWRCPYEKITVTQEDPQLISIQEAAEAFEANTIKAFRELGYTLPGAKNPDGLSVDMDSIAFDISRVELGLTRVMDEKGNCTLVPAWDFYGEAHAYRGGEEQIYHRFGIGRENGTLGTVNALDGSELRRRGYEQFW